MSDVVNTLHTVDDVNTLHAIDVGSILHDIGVGAVLGLAASFLVFTVPHMLDRLSYNRISDKTNYPEKGTIDPFEIPLILTAESKDLADLMFFLYTSFNINGELCRVEDDNKNEKKVHYMRYSWLEANGHIKYHSFVYYDGVIFQSYLLDIWNFFGILYKKVGYPFTRVMIDHKYSDQIENNIGLTFDEFNEICAPSAYKLTNISLFKCIYAICAPLKPNIFIVKK
jgi:hypothetical protein